MKNKGTPAPPPFEGYLVYAPVIDTRDGRRRVALTKIGDSKTRMAMAYARYLLSVKLGRRLEATEEADHVDNDKLNDVPSNLQVLSQIENIRKSAKGRTMVDLVCAHCGQEFQREKRQAGPGKGRFCSRSCRARGVTATAGTQPVKGHA